MVWLGGTAGASPRPANGGAETTRGETDMAKRPGRRAQLREKSREQVLVLTFGEPHADCEVCRVLGVAGGAERTGRSPEHRAPGGPGSG